jgi:hypothetical protein
MEQSSLITPHVPLVQVRQLTQQAARVDSAEIPL